jgi:hypothetical protein
MNLVINYFCYLTLKQAANPRQQRAKKTLPIVNLPMYSSRFVLILLKIQLFINKKNNFMKQLIVLNQEQFNPNSEASIKAINFSILQWIRSVNFHKFLIKLALCIILAILIYISRILALVVLLPFLIWSVKIAFTALKMDFKFERDLEIEEELR